MTLKNYLRVKMLIDEESIRGLKKLYRECASRCYELACHYSSQTPREKSELDSLHKLMDEIVTIWRMTPNRLLVATN